MRTIVTALWRASDMPPEATGVYDYRYVGHLAHAMKRMGGRVLVLADAANADVHRHPDLRHLRSAIDVVRLHDYGYGGWSHLIECWRPSCAPPPGERYAFAGLDTVFMRPAEWLFEDHGQGPIWATAHPDGPGVCSGMVSYTEEGAGLLWQRFVESHARGKMREFTYDGRICEMVLLDRVCRPHKWPTIDDKFPGRVASYKLHMLTGQRKDPDIVYCHGKPKPHAITGAVGEAWRSWMAGCHA